MKCMYCTLSNNVRFKKVQKEGKLEYSVWLQSHRKRVEQTMQLMTTTASDISNDHDLKTIPNGSHMHVPP